MNRTLKRSGFMRTWDSVSTNELTLMNRADRILFYI